MLVGVSQKSIKRWESGESPMPRAAWALANLRLDGCIPAADSTPINLPQGTNSPDGM